MVRVSLYLCDTNDNILQTLARREVSPDGADASKVIQWAHSLLRRGESGCLLVRAAPGRIETFRVQR